MSPDDLGSLQALQALNPKDCTEQVRALYVAVAIRLGDGTPTDQMQVAVETRRWFQSLDWTEKPHFYASSYQECSRDGNAAWTAYKERYPLDNDRLLLMTHLKEQCSEVTHTVHHALRKMNKPADRPFPLDNFIKQWDAHNRTDYLTTFATTLASMYPLEQLTLADDHDVRLAHAQDVFRMLSHAMASWKEPVSTMELPALFADATP